jgi:hypothetical protein
MAMIAPYNSGEEDEVKPERPVNPMYYCNYPGKPTVEVLEEMVARFRDLQWISVRYNEGWPEVLIAQHDGYEERPNAVCLLLLSYIYIY